MRLFIAATILPLLLIAFLSFDMLCSRDCKKGDEAEKKD